MSEARTYLATAALGYAAAVDATGDRPTDADLATHRATGEFLETCALQLAVERGVPGAAERAELDALRRFRDGVVALRAEVVELGDVHATGDSVAEHVERTIDALIAISYPPIAPKVPA